MALALYLAWPSEDPTGRALRQALGHAVAGIPGLADGCLISVLIDAAYAPPAPAVEMLLADVAGRLESASERETTLAIEPRQIAGRRLADYRAAGIGRLALRAGVLDGIAQDTLASASAVFARCAVDLSFGRPGQDLAGWRAELDRALEAGAGHVSLEEHRLAVDDVAADLYQAAVDHLGAAGLPPYEIAHCARPDHESRQLLHGATGGAYLGIGPGAIGRISAGTIWHALSQIAPADAWLRAVEAGTEAASEALSRDERATELLLSGLRLRAGVARAWFEPLAGRLEAALDTEQLASLIEDGFVWIDEQGLRLTERGWPLCDAVLARLLK